MKHFEFEIKTKIKFGLGISVNLNKYLKEFSFKRIGIIIDSKILDLSIIKNIFEKLNNNGFDIKIWKYDLNAEPSYDDLDRIKNKFMENKIPLIDCFVGIGGGSVMDFAKGLATLVVNREKSIFYKGFPININESLPTITIPTVSGTGSEVTYNAVFIDKKNKVKMGINTINNYPLLTILDPKLTLSCPISITSSTGMDGLVHTMESYESIYSNFLIKMFSRNAFNLLFNGLSKIIDDPTNIEIRSNLMLGSYLAGIAVNFGGGPIGALSYPLGVHFNVPHGIAGAVYLPYIIEHNINNGCDYSELYDLIDNTDKSISKNKKNKLFSEKFFELRDILNIPSDLKSFGVNEDNINILLEEIKKFKGAFDENPVLFTLEDGENLLKKLI